MGVVLFNGVIRPNISVQWRSTLVKWYCLKQREIALKGTTWATVLVASCAVRLFTIVDYTDAYSHVGYGYGVALRLAAARCQCLYSGKAAGRSLAELAGERGEGGEGKYSRAAGTASSLAHRANCC
ncbi:jg5375 [Pararge aegeria aegeria]|uniref:Jg5375 protein n=1 Tax=Pararge aegeria aegeria TaxID=348720 RepID=A0A8S4RP68_9NEOP|nr:jg5375 [Pararge aegeria aegeria]